MALWNFSPMLMGSTALIIRTSLPISFVSLCYS
jgi:hypothetical protein